MKKLIFVLVTTAVAVGACTNYMAAGVAADRVVAQIAAEAGEGLE